MRRSSHARRFVKGGGALIVGFSALGALGAGKAQAATGNTPFALRSPGRLPARPDAVDSWIAITAGQHGHRHPRRDGARSRHPDRHPHARRRRDEHEHGSDDLCAPGDVAERDRRRRRLAAASRAARRRPVRRLRTRSRCCSAWPRRSSASPSRASRSRAASSPAAASVKYGDLLGGQAVQLRDAAELPPAPSTTATQLYPGQPGITKPVSQYTLVGKAVQRIDIPAKVNGTYTYIQNVRIPGMLHARRVRPRGAGANTSVNHQPLSVDATSIAHIPGAQVVQIANFLAVVAPRSTTRSRLQRSSRSCGRTIRSSRRSGQLLVVDAPGRRHEHRQPGPRTPRTRAASPPRSPRRRTR